MDLVHNAIWTLMYAEFKRKRQLDNMLLLIKYQRGIELSGCSTFGLDIFELGKAQESLKEEVKTWLKKDKWKEQVIRSGLLDKA
jgi:hypothetical protein